MPKGLALGADPPGKLVYIPRLQTDIVHIPRTDVEKYGSPVTTGWNRNPAIINGSQQRLQIPLSLPDYRPSAPVNRNVMNAPTVATPSATRGTIAQTAAGVGLQIGGGLITQGPQYLNPSNPNGILRRDPVWSKAHSDGIDSIKRNPAGFYQRTDGKIGPDPFSPNFWGPDNPISPFHPRSPFNPTNIRKPGGTLYNPNNEGYWKPPGWIPPLVPPANAQNPPIQLRPINPNPGSPSGRPFADPPGTLNLRPPRGELNLNPPQPNPTSPTSPNRDPRNPIDPFNPTSPPGGAPNTNLPPGTTPTGSTPPTGGGFSLEFPPVNQPYTFSVQLFSTVHLRQGSVPGAPIFSTTPNVARSNVKDFYGKPLRIETELIDLGDGIYGYPPDQFPWYNRKIEFYIVYTDWTERIYRVYFGQIADNVSIGFDDPYVNLDNLDLPLNTQGDPTPTPPGNPLNPPNFNPPTLALIAPPNSPLLAPPSSPLLAPPSSPLQPINPPQNNPQNNLGSPPQLTNPPLPSPLPSAPPSLPQPQPQLQLQPQAQLQLQPQPQPQPQNSLQPAAASQSKANPTGSPIVPSPAISNATKTDQKQNQNRLLTPTPVGADGKLDPTKKAEIDNKLNPTPAFSPTPEVCQNPCLADLQRNQRDQQSKEQTTTVTFNRFLTWNRLTGRAIYTPETVQVPSSMADFARVMGNRTADIRARHGLAEVRAKLAQLLQIINVVTTLHNAAMLSTSLAQTLGSLVTEAFQAFGPLFGVDKETADAFDANEILGKAIDDSLKSLLGEQVWNGTKENWRKANRIISTASNIIWTVRSIGDSAREIGEFTAENTGKIGNALKKFGIVGESAYPWMPERVNGGSAWSIRMQRFRDGVENIDDAASSLSNAVSEVRSIREEVDELKEQKQTFDKAVKEAAPNTRPDNDPVKQAGDASKQASSSPTINPSDERKPED